MNRRSFLSAIPATCLAGSGSLLAAQEELAPFALDYAPHFGMFRNSAPGGLLDELQFAIV